MTADVEDDALSWGDESDPSYAPDAPAPAASAAPLRVEPVERRTEPVEVTSPTTEPASGVETAKPGTTSFLLVSYGILAGAYLIYTLGWLVVVLGPLKGSVNADVLGELMYRLTQVLAVASPAIWFGAAFLLTRGSRPIVRLLALLAGLVAVLPWPFILLGA